MQTWIFTVRHSNGTIQVELLVHGLWQLDSLEYRYANIGSCRNYLHSGEE